MSKLMVFTGNANPELAKLVVERLDIPLGEATVGKFSDGETTVELDENVRGKDVFILQPTCAPTNDNLMEVLLLADSLRRASASRINRCSALLRLCSPGSSSTLCACAYQRSRCRRHDVWRWHRPCFDRRFAR